MESESATSDMESESATSPASNGIMESESVQYYTEKMAGFMGSMDKSMQSIAKNMRSMNNEIKGLRTDVKGLRTDVKGLRTDVTRLSENVTHNFPDPIVQAAQNYIKHPIKRTFMKLIEQLQKLRQQDKATYDDSFATPFVENFIIKSGRLKEFSPTVAELLESVGKSSAESVQMSKFKGLKNYFWRVYSAAVPCIDLEQDASDGIDHSDGSKHAGTNFTSENDGDDEDSQESQNKSKTTVKTKTPPVNDLAATHILFEAAIVAVASESPEGKIVEDPHFTRLWEHYITEVVERHVVAQSPQLFHFATTDDNLDYFDADDQKIGNSGKDDVQDLAERGSGGIYDEIGTSGKDDVQDLAETGEAAESKNADDEVAPAALPVEIISVASTAARTENSQLDLVFYPFKHYSRNELDDARRENRVRVWVETANIHAKKSGKKPGKKGRKKLKNAGKTSDGATATGQVAVVGKTDLVAKSTKYAIELKRFQYHPYGDHQSVHSNALLQACWESQALLQQNRDDILRNVAALRKQMMVLQKNIEAPYMRLRTPSAKDGQRATCQKSLAEMKEEHKKMVAQIATAVVLVTDGIFSNLVISPEPRVIIITERAKDEVERRAMVDYWCQSAIAFKNGKPLALPRVGKGGFAKLLENYFTDPNPANGSISAECDESNPGATTDVTTPMMADVTQASLSVRENKKRPTNAKDKSQRKKR